MKETTVEVSLETMQDLRAFYGSGEDELKKQFSNLGIEITNIKVVSGDFLCDFGHQMECPEIGESYKILSRTRDLVSGESGIEFYLQRVK